jgi:hypothetical protein
VRNTGDNEKGRNERVKSERGETGKKYTSK